MGLFALLLLVDLLAVVAIFAVPEKREGPPELVALRFLEGILVGGADVPAGRGIGYGQAWDLVAPGAGVATDEAEFVRACEDRLARDGFIDRFELEDPEGGGDRLRYGGLLVHSGRGAQPVVRPFRLDLERGGAGWRVVRWKVGDP